MARMTRSGLGGSLAGVRRFFFFSSRRRHTRFDCDWSSDVCSSDLTTNTPLVFIGAVKISPPGKLPHLSRVMIPLVFSHLNFGESSASNSVPCGVLQIGRASCRERV